MDQETKETNSSPSDDWMKNAMDFWKEVGDFQSQFFSSLGVPGDSTKAQQAQKSWKTSGKVFQAYLNSLTKPESIESLMKGFDAIPDFFGAALRQNWEGYVELQKQWTDQMLRLGKQTKAYSFEDIDENTFRTIRDLYSKEFQKFLKVPPLGLTRFYQEKFANMVDKYNIFQTTLGEFIYIFCVPIEKTGAAMQEKLEEMAESGEILDDFKSYYNMWIRILEGHYMTLLKSPEYTQAMDNTISAAVQYRDAKESFLCDVLQNLPIPTNREMDELYKEFYLLKKQVRALKRQVEDLCEEKSE